MMVAFKEVHIARTSFDGGWKLLNALPPHSLWLVCTKKMVSKCNKSSWNSKSSPRIFLQSFNILSNRRRFVDGFYPTVKAIGISWQTWIIPFTNGLLNNFLTSLPLCSSSYNLLSSKSIKIVRNKAFSGLPLTYNEKLEGFTFICFLLYLCRIPFWQLSWWKHLSKVIRN